jgi:hypothetical protein
MTAKATNTAASTAIDHGLRMVGDYGRSPLRPNRDPSATTSEQGAMIRPDEPHSGLETKESR